MRAYERAYNLPFRHSAYNGKIFTSDGAQIMRVSSNDPAISANAMAIRITSILNKEAESKIAMACHFNEAARVISLGSKFYIELLGGTNTNRDEQNIINNDLADYISERFEGKNTQQ